MSYYDDKNSFTIHFTEYRAAGIFKTNWTPLKMFYVVTKYHTNISMNQNVEPPLVFFPLQFRRSF